LVTPQIQAPEVLDSRDEYSEASDWWAFGCLLYEMAVGVVPFNNEDDISVF